MQAIFETMFDVCYLAAMITLGILMFRRGMQQNRSIVKKFGVMAILLGAGDAFHLVPRVYALWTTGLEAHAASLGFGKFITSITMTVFYLLLYYVWRDYYHISGRKNLTTCMWVLTLARVVLCLFPQNQWLQYKQPLSWGIIRNVPFAIIGILIIVLFVQEQNKTQRKTFAFMPLAVGLSFAFYIPVVLFASSYPMIGMLMIPKTLAYVWIVLMGWNLSKTPSEGSQT